MRNDRLRVFIQDLFNRNAHLGPARAVTFSPGEGTSIAAGFGKEKLVVFDVETGKEILIGLMTGACTSIAFSPDGKLLASGSWDTTVRIWDVATGQQAMDPLTGHTKYVTSLGFSPDGKLLASGSHDKTVRMWDVFTGKQAMHPLTGHRQGVNSVAFSPDGKLLASGSDD